MADTTLQDVEHLAALLSPGDQKKLIDHLTDHLVKTSAKRQKSKPELKQIQRDLDKAWGAWGNKTADEIDREINEMRQKDWSRDWPKDH